MTPNALVADNISAEYAGTLALHEVSLTLEPGQRIALMGRSGSGKSTLLKVLLALQPATEGTVTFNGQEVHPGSVKSLDWYRRQVQYIPQDPAGSLPPAWTVRRILTEPMRHLGVPGDHATIAADMLGRVQLGVEFLRRRRHELSGGQAQRVAIARALATGATHILADEPISGLDLPLRNEVLRTFQALDQVALLFVTHDLEAAGALCSHGIVLDGGRVAERGPMNQLLRAPQHPETQALVAAIPQLP